MSHILGVYWAPGHQRQADIEYMQRLQPPAIRVLDPDPNQLVIAHKAAPKALLLPRDWALSEQHEDVRRDPVGTGKRHAHDWRGKLDRWRADGATLPPDNQIIVVGINEMQVWTMLPQAVEYTVAMLDECTNLGLRACALNLSVGWPANNGTDTPPDWKPYAPVEGAIKRGNHILTLHSYWYRSGPQDGAGWWAWRHHACPWDVPICIGECGADLYVDMPRWENDGKPNRGWRGNMSPDQYAAQMEQYARGCDTRVIAILPFLTDYRSNNWESFDTLEAHGALLARKDAMVPQVQFATPPPANGPTATPSTPAGARVRKGPGKSYEVLGAVAKGIPILVTGRNADSTWYRVSTPIAHVTGWVSATVVNVSGVEDVPVVEDEVTEPVDPPPSGDTWSRCIEFVLKAEGGWADNPLDPGGATMRGVTIGTFTRWREAHGQPVPTKDDLRNISDAELHQIYKEWYWIPSGASQMPFPMCLAVLDLAVNGGVERAKEALSNAGHDFVKYMAWRIAWYTRISNFEHFGKAWIRRCSDLMMEASKA